MALSVLKQGFHKAALILKGAGRTSGPSFALKLAHTVRSESEAKKARRLDHQPGLARTPGPLQSVVEIDSGIVCTFEEADLEIRFLESDLVRVTWGPGDLPLPFAIKRVDWPSVPVSVTKSKGGVSISTTSLHIEIGPEGSIKYLEAGGTLIRDELAPLRRGASRTFRQSLRKGERVAGLGEQAGNLDLAGSTHRLWNRDPGGSWGPGQDPLYCPIPVMVFVHPDSCVLSFFENSYAARISISAPNGLGAQRVDARFCGGVLRHYVVVGKHPRTLLQRYFELTGKPSFPPRWALGYHQSKWGYRCEADVKEVSKGFSDEGLPLSAIHLDIDYMDGYRIFTIDSNKFPDLFALASELECQGTRLVAIVDPAVKIDPNYDIYEKGCKDRHFVTDEAGKPIEGVVWPGPVVYPDFTSKSARDWFGSYYKRLLDKGIAGIWHDMNEPASLALTGDRTLPLDARLSMEGRGGDHREAHNLYGLLMDKVGFESLQQHRADRRPWVLSRSGWAGVAKWAWLWTGDVESSWDGLRYQVRTALSLSLSGVPFVGSDCGGFSGTPDAELFVRWLEMSVFMPFCRTHCSNKVPPREPWRWEQPYKDLISRLICLRYRLLPYLYTLSHEVSEAGVPIIRPLFWSTRSAKDDGSDQKTSFVTSDSLWTDNAFLLGDDVLVAPITSKGSISRTVVLPPGDWYRWSLLDKKGTTPLELICGGQSVRFEAPLGEPVTFVRAGSILALDDGFEEKSGPVSYHHEPRLLSLHCFADKAGNASGRCYDDIGDGYKESRMDHFSLIPTKLKWDRYGEFPPPSNMRVVLHEVTTETGSTTRIAYEGPPFDELDI